MNRRLKQLFAIFMAVTLAIAEVQWTGKEAEAVSDFIREGQADVFSYELNEDGTCRISKYTGEETDVVIPSELDNGRVATDGKVAVYDSAENGICIADADYSVLQPGMQQEITLEIKKSKLKYNKDDTAYFWVKDVPSVGDCDESDNSEVGITYGSVPEKIGKVTLVKVSSPSKGKMKVKWKKDEGDGYQIAYSTSKKFLSGKTTVKKVKNNCTQKIFKRLKKGKTYYVRIRAYKKSDSKTNYGKWSKILKIKIKK